MVIRGPQVMTMVVTYSTMYLATLCKNKFGNPQLHSSLPTTGMYLLGWLNIQSQAAGLQVLHQITTMGK